MYPNGNDTECNASVLSLGFYGLALGLHAFLDTDHIVSLSQTALQHRVSLPDLAIDELYFLRNRFASVYRYNSLPKRSPHSSSRKHRFTAQIAFDRTRYLRMS